MKLIRYILFIPLCLIAINLVYWLFGLLFIWFIGLSTLWHFVVLFFFGGAIWVIFQRFSEMLVALSILFSPNRMFSFITVLIISVINGIMVIYNCWTMDINYSGRIILASIVFTILVIVLTFSLIIGSFFANEEY